MTKFVNLTPHNLSIINKNKEVVTIETSGTIARVTSKDEVISVINGIEIHKQTFGEVENLLEPIENTIFIVSRMVKDRLTNRNDVLVPSNLVRDVNGDVIGANGLSL